LPIAQRAAEQQRRSLRRRSNLPAATAATMQWHLRSPGAGFPLYYSMMIASSWLITIMLWCCNHHHGSNQSDLDVVKPNDFFILSLRNGQKQYKSR
jgi:hypothetical protein